MNFFYFLIVQCVLQYSIFFPQTVTGTKTFSSPLSVTNMSVKGGIVTSGTVDSVRLSSLADEAVMLNQDADIAGENYDFEWILLLPLSISV